MTDYSDVLIELVESQHLLSKGLLMLDKSLERITERLEDISVSLEYIRESMKDNRGKQND